jgi:hypothetical protein
VNTQSVDRELPDTVGAHLRVSNAALGNPDLMARCINPAIAPERLRELG